MRFSVYEYIMKKQAERGDSDTGTAKLLGVAQPSFHKFKRGGVSIRAEHLIRYAQGIGCEVVIMPKEYIGVLRDDIAVIDYAVD